MGAEPALPCLLFEDDHLLVVNKPAGWNTHSPAAHAVEGIYDWLRHREPRWTSLSILHRLDKDTSGVLVFGKTRLANQSITAQFTRRTVRKEYQLATDRPVRFRELEVRSDLVRQGEIYHAQPVRNPSKAAVTRFRVQRQDARRTELIAQPATGQTHQIRVHAASNGFPILGDRLYGGTRSARAGPDRLWLHASSIELQHPATGKYVRFQAPVDFGAYHPLDIRLAFLDPTQTNAFRILNGAADGWPGCYVDRYGNYLLCQQESPVPGSGTDWRNELRQIERRFNIAGTYTQTAPRQLEGRTPAELSPQQLAGAKAPDAFEVLENGVRYECRLAEGYSVGLFLDQRDNRRRLQRNHVAAGFAVRDQGMAGATVLNTFAYTCGFSVCAALAGARTTSVDLSRKYLEWGRRNFEQNTLDPAGHEFLQGDVFDWLRRLARKNRRFDVVVLDPPTFSRSRESGTFRAEKDYPRLLAAALDVLAPRGVLLACSNAANWRTEPFVKTVRLAVHEARRSLVQEHFAPQPPDFPTARNEPAYLKTLWARVG